MGRSPQPTAAPLITRRTTLGFGVLFFAAMLVYPFLFTASGRGSGALGAAAALALAVGTVSCLVVWVGGAVLAARRQSFLWLLVALVLPPFGSLACALLMGATPPSRPR
jgi:sulfite exporter TauE/SafE